MAQASERAYEEIRSGIINGDYPAGTRLGEEQLAESIGVSRTPIREALRRLASEGIVEYSRNRGVHVPEWSRQDLDEIFALRALLEGYAASLAATRRNHDDLDELTDLDDRMQRLAREPDEDARTEIAFLNNEFHRLVLRMSGSRRLNDLMAGLVQVPLVRRTFLLYSDAELARSMTHHNELLAAIEARDPEWARAVLSSHILSARHVYP